MSEATIMRRRGPGRAVQGLALAGLLAFCGVLIALPAIAFEPLSGNKNFSSPGSVPDYFSNEAAPFGHASHPAAPGADRFNTAPGKAESGHASVSQPARSAVVSTGHGLYHIRLAERRTGRHVAFSRSGHAHAAHARGRSARPHFYARAASRHWIATRHRAAASRTRYAAHSARHSRRLFR
jgi:hypothetical protein